MNQISTPHNTPASEVEMGGFDCVQGMNISLIAFDHNRASPAQAQSGWLVSWVWWHRCGFEAVDGGVPTSVPPILLSASMVRRNDFLGDAIWAEGTVGSWIYKWSRHRPFCKWKYFICVPWVLSHLWAPVKRPFSCSRSGVKNEGAPNSCLHDIFESLPRLFPWFQSRQELHPPAQSV